MEEFKRDDLEAKLVKVMTEHCKETMTIIPSNLEDFVYDCVSDLMGIVREETE